MVTKLELSAQKVAFYEKTHSPGRPSMEILAKILPRYCQELQDVMVRSYQENQVPKKTFIVKSYLCRKDLKGSQQKK